jgi:3-deoxy-D-manno-octulosonate 8-phosphate phosphatase (KDO 8-P phosphatase)
MQDYSAELIAKASKIRLLILDVDGVLSDGRIIVTDSGEEIKAFHVQDGLGIQLLLENGIQVAVISGRNSPLVEKRIRDLKIPYLYQGQFNKIAAFEDVLAKTQITAEHAAHVGDDLPDIALFKRVGLAIAVNNATVETKQQSHMQTQNLGGHGAVREICEFILKAQNKWPAIVERFVG